MELPDKIPAYNSAGKEYKRILPPIRNRKIIEVDRLAKLLEQHSPTDVIQWNGVSLAINGIPLTFTEGVCKSKRVTFAFTELWDCLRQLRYEKILEADTAQCRDICKSYYNE